MRIVPAIDIIEGKCVRLSKGDYQTKKIYNEHPIEVAKSFEAHGISYLHVVDLDGAKSRRVVNHHILEQIVRETSLKVDFGGGIKTNEDIHIAFESGATQVTVGSIAVQKPDCFVHWLERYGAESLILGADTNSGKIAIEAWQEISDKDVISFIGDYKNRGVKYVICTDISKDGMLKGPSHKLYQEIISTYPEINLIASGGVSSMEDIRRLYEEGCEAAIIGKSIYEGYISLEELEPFL